jgi:hypothetical protein
MYCFRSTGHVAIFDEQALRRENLSALSGPSNGQAQAASFEAAMLHDPKSIMVYSPQDQKAEEEEEEDAAVWDQQAEVTLQSQAQEI